MHAANTSGQRFVHSGHDGPHLRGRFIARQHGVEPFHLVRIELFDGGVVERNKIDIALRPVIISVQFVILGIVFQALRAEGGCPQPVGKLHQPRFARHRRDGFMISHQQIHGQLTEWNNLVRDEIRPGFPQVGGGIERPVVQAKFGGRRHVFVESIDGAEIAQVPVECGAALVDASGDGGHDDVATVAGVA